MLNIFPNALYSGDAIPLPLSFTDSTTGNPTNLTGKTIGLTVKLEPQDSDDTRAPFMKNLTGDATGKVTFIIPGLAAATYWIDVKIWTTGASPSDRNTVIGALPMKILQSVTTRIA